MGIEMLLLYKGSKVAASSHSVLLSAWQTASRQTHNLTVKMELLLALVRLWPLINAISIRAALLCIVSLYCRLEVKLI